MSLRKLNVLLAVLLLGCVWLNWELRREADRPNYEFLPEMVRTPAYDSFAPNPNFPDGATLRPPEPGTIARGQLPLHYPATPEGAVQAGQELANPFAADDLPRRQRGAFVYANFCQPCHGPAGKGDGPVARRGFPPPASLLQEKAVQMKDGQMFHVLTYGQGNMAPYAPLLSRDDRWCAILHVRALQQTQEKKQP